MALLVHLPPALIDDFLARAWLPIVGAGFSKNASLPQGERMPDWSELALDLAADMPDYLPARDPSDPPPHIDAIDVISAYEDRFDRPRLTARLSDALHERTARPGPVHAAFCALAFDVVCTTNFDFLLEQQYALNWPPCLPVVDETMLTRRPPEQQVQLVKLHGDLHHPARLVATERDYDLFVAQNPLVANYVANLLVTRTPVLIGYSLDDPDVRGLWSIVSERLGRLRRTGYAIVVAADPNLVARFARRGIEVIDLPPEPAGYGATLLRLFAELRDLWHERFPAYGAAADDDVAAELALPSDESRRLCYVSVPSRLVGWYRDLVFPVVEAAGFVPVSVEDIDMPGRTVLATVEALIARASFAVIDVDSVNGGLELAAARSRLAADRVVAVMTPQAGVPEALLDRGGLHLVRTQESMSDPTAFLDDLAGMLGEAARTRPAAEPARLLEVGEPKAAAIAAVAVLEATLRDLVGSSGQPGQADLARGRSRGLRALLYQASQLEIMAAGDLDVAMQALDIRNRLAHGLDVPALQAASAARSVLELLRRLGVDSG